MLTAQALEVVEVERITAEMPRNDLVHGVSVTFATGNNALVVVAL
jgi:hypothetical protein